MAANLKGTALAWLMDQEETFDIPEPGEFGPSGFIGPWRSVELYQFMTQSNDVREVGASEVTEQGDWLVALFTDATIAAAAMKELGERGGPQRVIRVQAATDRIMNLNPKYRDRFGDVLSYTIPVSTYRSKYRYAYHMFWLPSVVSAAARLMGIDVPELNVSELVGDPENIAFTPEFQATMIGSKDVPWAESTMWKRRAEIWAALGEDDPMHYLLSSDNEAWVATSDNFRECLKVALKPWKKDVLARVASVADPREDAVSKKSEKRLSVQLVVELFNTEGEAQAAAKEDIDRMNSSETVSVSTTDVVDSPVAETNTPPLPEAWEDIPDDFMGAISTAFAEGKSAPAIAKDFEMTVPQVIAWKKYLDV